MQRGAVGAGAGNALVAQRYQHGQRDGLEAGEERNQPTEGGGADGEQLHRHQRFAEAPLLGDEQQQGERRQGEQAEQRRVAPGCALADLGDGQEQRGEAHHHQHDAQVVDHRLPARHRQADQGSPRDGQREKADRQVDPEYPAPRQVLGEQAAEHRAGDAGDGVHAAEVTLVAAALARRDDVADDRLAHRHQPARADPLQHSRQHQLAHALREPAKQRGGGEHDDGEEHQTAAAVEVAELAVDRHRYGHRHHVGRDHPGQQVEVGVVGRDRRQGDGDDGLVEGAEEDRQHQSGEDGTDGGRVLGEIGQDGTWGGRNAKAAGIILRLG
ncbi:hypothetical protein PAERUG_E15_London_28_01_14_03632 [Pseudomonas aeruginosa]|nr:hypothetical protein PAERUG_E15_London_28_01_14_03632 [Pseudomonas aeruginosa]